MKKWIKFFIVWLILTIVISNIFYFLRIQLWTDHIDEMINKYITKHARTQEDVADIVSNIYFFIFIIPCAVIAYFATVYSANKSKNANKENSEPPSAR